MPFGTQYEQQVAKTLDYTLTVADDVAVFTIAVGKTATLPLAANCSLAQQFKQIINVSGSSNDLTIAVQTGNTLVGENTLSPGETTTVRSDGVAIWYSTGSSGVTGVSGYSGFSGASGYSGFSGYSGYSGKSGFSGYSGVSGWSGWSGYSGVSGYSGKSGYSGYSGYTGVSGYSGYSGFSKFP
jgi:hypothetical protein